MGKSDIMMSSLFLKGLIAMNIPVGTLVSVQSYKHDKSLHRIWQEAKVISDTEDCIIVANKRTKVIEANGRFWYTKEPSVTFFYKKRWFNVIGILKPTGVGFYCNLSSPVIIDEEALKYIDYDLDVKVSEHGQINLLDQNEYRRHRAQMGYPAEVCQILEEEFLRLQEWIKTGAEPFQAEIIRQWYRIYQQIQEAETC